jgi:enoyl-CoA hydratase
MTAWDLLKPVVAIVHGNCLAGGTELMSFADIVFAAHDARIGYPPMRAMSTPDIPVMPWKMTMARAKYLQLTGNSITGETAAQWGWVAKSFPAEELQERAWAEIRALSHVDAGLLAANKQQVNQAYETMGMRTHLAQAWAWHYLSGNCRPKGGEFFNRVQEDGLKAALQWMNGPFKYEGIL